MDKDKEDGQLSVVWAVSVYAQGVEVSRSRGTGPA